MFLAIFSVILIYCLVYERHVSLLHILNLHVGEQGLSYEHVPASHTISTRNIFASRSHRIPPRCHRRYKKTDLSFPPTSHVHSFFFFTSTLNQHHRHSKCSNTATASPPPRAKHTSPSPSPVSNSNLNYPTDHSHHLYIRARVVPTGSPNLRACVVNKNQDAIPRFSLPFLPDSFSTDSPYRLTLLLFFFSRSPKPHPWSCFSFPFRSFPFLSFQQYRKRGEELLSPILFLGSKM